MTKSDLIQKIVELGFDEKTASDLNKLKKDEIQEIYTQAMETLGATEEEKALEEPEKASEELEETPNMYDPHWTDWVLEQLEDYEKEGGNPKVDGLRRIANKILGPFSIESTIHQTPDNSNGQRSTVSVRVLFSNRTIVYSGAADVSGANTDKTFAVFPVATAETRAEGRALKRALCLTKVVSAEEIYDKNIQDLSDQNAKASSSMINSLKMMAEKLKVDPFALAIYHEFDIEDVSDLKRSQVQQLNATLSRYHRQEEQIPEAVARK